MHSSNQAIPAAALIGNASVMDPSFDVILPSGKIASWNISQNLTDRWGEFNEYDSAFKPLQPLMDSPELIERLQNQMWDELSFVVRKDGQYGILFEMEFPTKLSEVNLLRPEDPDYEKYLAELPSEDDCKLSLIAAIAELALKYPTVQFCLPPKEEMVEERLGIWAFFADGQLDEAVRVELGRALLKV